MDKEIQEIKNKTIVITGGAEGIGLEIAKSFLNENAKLVYLIDINEQKGNEAVAELTTKFGAEKAVFIKCDVVKDLEDTYQKICDGDATVDVLVNSAGIADESSPNICINVNLIATMEWSYKFLEHMRKYTHGKGGTIINIASIFGYRVAPCCPIYHASKFGVVGFTKSFGHEKNYNKHGVRIIAICPGFTFTNLSKPVLESKGGDLVELRENYKWQSEAVVGEKAVEVFNNAVSGSVWEIEDGVVKEVK